MATAHNNHFRKSSFFRKYKCTTCTGNSILKFKILKYIVYHSQTCKNFGNWVYRQEQFHVKSKIPHNIIKASLSYQCLKGSIPNLTQSFSLKLHRSNNTEHTRKDFNCSCILFLAQWVKMSLNLLLLNIGNSAFHINCTNSM